MPQLVVSAGFAAVGFAIAGPAGAQAGWAIGSVVGSLLFAPEGPKPELQDTSAPKIDMGAKMHRVEGTIRVPLSPRWVDEWTATEQEAGGKGGGGGSSYYTYSTNALFWAADGTNVEGWTRIWKNGVLVASRHASSDAASIVASEETEHWSEVEFFDGNASQLPFTPYEAAVGSANADGHRGMACLGFTGLQGGNSPQMPFLEAEIYTNGNQGPALTKLQSYFTSDTEDISAYAHGPGTLNGDCSVVGGVLTIAQDGGALVPSYLDYASLPDLQSNGTDALTAECFATWGSSPNSAGVPFFEVWLNSADTGTRYSFQWYADDGRVRFETSSFGDQYISASPVLGRTHFAIVWGASSFRAYIGGVLVYEEASTVPNAAPLRVRLGDWNGVVGASSFTIDSFRVRQEEVYTANFTPPDELPPPDGFTADPQPEDLADVVERQCQRAGLTADQYDVTDLAGIEVAGFKYEGSPREAIEELAGTYYFYAIAGRKVVFRLMDAASLVTIPASDTGVGVDQPGEVFAGLMRGNDLELPAQLSITAPNPSADYDPGTATSDRIVTVGTRKDQTRLDVVLTPAQLKGRANAGVLDARVAAHTATVTVDDRYAAYEPGDVVTHVDAEGNSYTTRWVRETYAQGVKTVDVRLFDRSVLTLTGTMSDTFTPSFTVTPAGESSLVLLDTHLLRDEDDDNVGPYAAVDGSGNWEGAVIYRSTDDASFSQVVTTTVDATTGTANTTLGDHAGGWVLDRANTLRVTVTGQLTSSSQSAMRADREINVLQVGDEIIRFRTATLVSSTADTYTYDLTILTRGCRGTDAYIGTHAANETVLLLKTNAVRRLNDAVADVGATRYWKAVTAGRLLASATSQSLANTGRSKKPWSPVHLTATRDVATGDITFAWQRRTRLLTRAGGPGGSYVPLGEDSERYEVDVYADGAYATVLRTLSATTPSAAYTAAQQTADFGSTQSTVYVRVYQLSAAVGRGYPLEASA